MTLKVQNLTKVYDQQRAVDDISFEVGKGEIVGFLGPNGAGKSTTMKVIASLLPATEGKVHVIGIDTVDDPMGVRRAIGYLPENNPLYSEMYVHEYLRFVGRLYGLHGPALRERVREVITLFGLEPEQNKKIEMLSKGYRQRVGLAQSLIHDPQVLILDEPTSGLDPNQLVEIRNLVKKISKDKTVLFSTHIMQEVTALCDRAIVINKGKIVADDKIANLLTRKESGQAVIAEFEKEIPLELLNSIPGVTAVEEVGTNRWKIASNTAVDLRAEIFRLAANNNLSLVGLKQEEGTLENLFKELTASKEE